MSLEAKAFVLAQDAEDPGVLMLSALTGTAEQLTDAVLINPYDANEASHAEYPLEASEICSRLTSRRYSGCVFRNVSIVFRWQCTPLISLMVSLPITIWRG